MSRTIKGVRDDVLADRVKREVRNKLTKRCGCGELGAHDLRRTFAKLAHKDGAGLDQIQLSLGHVSIRIRAESFIRVVTVFVVLGGVCSPWSRLPGRRRNRRHCQPQHHRRRRSR